MILPKTAPMGVTAPFMPSYREGFGLRPSFLPVFAPEDGGGDPDDDFDAASAFFENLNGPEEEGEAAAKAAVEAPEGAAEEAEEGAEEAGEGEGSPEGAQAAQATQEADPDDAEIELKIGEQTQKAKLRDLKAAFAQRTEAETASRAAVEARQKAQAESERAVTALTKAAERAEARYKPYADVDWLVLSQQLDAETLAQVRKDAKEALDDYNFYKTELDGAVTQQREAARARYQAECKAAADELRDPAKGIPGFDQKMFSEIGQYASTLGVKPEAFGNVTQAWIIRALHKAMLYDKGAQAAATQVRKVVNQPTKVLRPTGTQPQSETALTRKTAMARLSKSGALDDAADAFLASFSD